MKLLRRIIRQLILEGPAFDEFEELWFNREEGDEAFFDRNPTLGVDDMDGTYHKGMFKQKQKDLTPSTRWTEKEIDELFDEKRDLKRAWNAMIDKRGLRSFWEGPKMQYFHSLMYYDQGIPTDELETGVAEEDSMADLTMEGFLKKYKLKGNRDEMSTYGVYNGVAKCSRHEKFLGVLIEGRVTLASSMDAFVESRSKATKGDMQRHKGSGMPKRMLPTDDFIQSLLFDESDIKAAQGYVGECVVDNWDVVAIVYDPKQYPEADYSMQIQSNTKQSYTRRGLSWC